MYKLDKGLVDLINAQRAEAEEFSKQPGCFMGMMPAATELSYWESRVPSGTLKEYERIELEESAYYMAADAMSKSYARSLDLRSMSDADLHQLCDAMAVLMKADAQEEQMREEAEQNHFDSLAADLNVDRNTLDRWMESA
tara:strand:- start:174 stop:593 length:420 start_codon:yes stop_codon:yes gene_type:complete